MEYMHKTKIHQFPKRPDEQSPFEYAHKMMFFEFFDHDRDQRKYFDDYMAIRRQGLVVWHETFPMASQLGQGAKKDPDAMLLVDVGGGWGHDIQSFRKTHPDVPGRLILQDRPVMIEKFDNGAEHEGFEVMRYDFYTPQPIKGQITSRIRQVLRSRN